MLTGYRPSPALDHATYGSVLASSRPQPEGLPAFVAVPNFRVGGANFTGNGFLPEIFAPFETGGDPSKPKFQVSGLAIGRLDYQATFCRNVMG